MRNNDLEIARGDFTISATEADCIAQAITIRLKTLAGEWFLDSNVGIPYFTDVFGYKRSERFVEQLVASEMKSIPSIKELTGLKAEIGADRTAHIRFNASLSDGSSITFNDSIGL